MLNQREILAAIERRIAAGAGGFAVMAACVCDLREVGIRYGSACGEAAEADAERLLRESLRPQDEVFRAGDELFAVILPELPARNHALLATTRLFQAFERPLNHDSIPWQGRLRMGMAFFPQDGTDADTLWRRSQMALHYAARSSAASAFFNEHDSRVDIDYRDLREGIEANHLLTYFQPVWALSAPRVVGVESLARWNSPRQGAVSPDQFVTFAEQSDLIVALTHWSINASFRHAAALNGLGLSVSINLSARAFAHGGVPEQLMDALNIWGVAPGDVIAEFTETALVENFDLTVRTLHKLRDFGMRVAIDDFGTGYASLTYLSRFPATDLKIDKTLIKPISHDARSARLAEAIVELGHRLDMIVTAEGIEDGDTRHLLAEMGCDLGQGFHLGMPQPAAEFARQYLAETVGATDFPSTQATEDESAEP